MRMINVKVDLLLVSSLLIVVVQMYTVPKHNLLLLLVLLNSIILVEYGKYCYLVLLSCMSLRSIAGRASLKQLSLRSIPSSFTVNLDRVKDEIGQTYGRVEAHEWKYRYLYMQKIQKEVQQEVQ